MAPKAPFALLRCRFCLHSVAPPPYQAQQEESRGEQRQAGRLWDRVGARGRDYANRQRSQVYGLIVGRVGTDDRVEGWPLEKTPRPLQCLLSAHSKTTDQLAHLARNGVWGVASRHLYTSMMLTNALITLRALRPSSICRGH